MRVSNTRSSGFLIRKYPLGGGCDPVFCVGRMGTAASSFVVLVEPMSSANWSQLGLEIKSIILNNTGEFLDLHFLPGGISLLGTRGVSFLNRMGTSWMPSMGDSLGLKGDGKPGILGDYVTWSQGGTTIKCALTNYHDVRYGERLMGPSGLAFLKHLDQYGASPTSPPSENITLDLADMDHQASLAQSDNSMGGIRHKLIVTQGSITKRESSGFNPIPEQLRILNHDQETLERLEQKRSILNTMPEKIRDVIATSGKAILGKRIMDWALIRLDEKSSRFLFAQQDVRRPRSPIPITLWRHCRSRAARVPDCSI